MTWTQQQVAEMPAFELDIRIALKVGMLDSVTFVHENVTYPWDIDNWWDPTIPYWYQEIRFKLNPMAPGRYLSPPTICSDETEIDDAEERAATLYEYPGGSGEPRARAETLFYWLTQNAS